MLFAASDCLHKDTEFPFLLLPHRQHMAGLAPLLLNHFYLYRITIFVFSLYSQIGAQLSQALKYFFILILSPLEDVFFIIASCFFSFLLCFPEVLFFSLYP